MASSRPLATFQSLTNPFFVAVSQSPPAAARIFPSGEYASDMTRSGWLKIARSRREPEEQTVTKPSALPKASSVPSGE